MRQGYLKRRRVPVPGRWPGEGPCAITLLANGDHTEVAPMPPAWAALYHVAHASIADFRPLASAGRGKHTKGHGMMGAPSSEVFNGVPLFAGLDGRMLEVIAAAACTRICPKSQVIFWEGDPRE